MADLPQSGVELVVKNAAQATRDINGFVAAMRKQVVVSKEVSHQSISTSKFTQALSKDFSGMGRNILSQIPVVGRFSNLLGTVGSTGATAAGGAQAAAAGTAAMGAGMAAALPVIGAVAIAITAATAGFYAFWKVGVRGAQLQNSLAAFANIVGDIENTNTVLDGLRNATRGTVSDMELMRLTTTALQGQTREFREVLLKTENGVTNLGKVLDITSRAARVTGQSEEYIREKFLSGLRLQSKLKLDDIGVTYDAIKVNNAYAESIGKTAAQLTDAEKKQAFLNNALSQLERIGAEAPISSIQDALARIGVAFQNVKDKIALLIQPMFEPMAKAVSALISYVENGVNNLLFILKPFVDIMGAIMTELQDTVVALGKALFGDFAAGTTSTMNYIIAAFQLMGEAVVAVIHAIGSGIRAAIAVFQAALQFLTAPLQKFFGSVGETVNGNINQLAFNLGKGGAAIIGSFAAGIIRGGTYVLQAVTEIAQIVADFLMGFSPPRKGILSTIDKGGENVAIAWAEGFSGGVEKSFSEATQFVNDRLGEIAYYSREQLEAGLSALDLAIRPFKESLAIVKADMQAIAGFTDPAMRILERQRTALLKAFGKGQSGLDVEQLRVQDRQIQRLKELKELGLEQVDQAELQLALAESQQAQQRALYNIALDRLGKEQEIGEAAKQAGGGGGGGGAGGGGKGGGAGGAEEGGAGLPMGGGGIPDLLTNAGIEEAKANIIAAISGLTASGAAGIEAGLAESGVSDALAALKGQSGALKNQIGRIAKSDPAQAIAKKFAGLKDAVSGAINEFKEFIETTFDNLFGDNGSVTKTLDGIRAKITGTFSGAGNPLESVQSAFSSLQGAVDPIIKSLFGDPDGIVVRALNTVRDKFTEVFGGATSPLETAQTSLTELKNNLENIFKPIFEFDVAGAAETVFSIITGVFDEVRGLVDGLNASAIISEIKLSLTNLVSEILDSVKIVDVDSIVEGFENVLSRIREAIESFPTDTITKGLGIASAIGGIAMRSLGIGGGDDEGGDNPQQSTQNLLAGLEISLPEEVKTQLAEVGRSITAAIATGIGGEESLALMTETLTTLYDTISTTFTSLFIGEESILFLSQMAIMDFVVITGEQLELFRSAFETVTTDVDLYLRRLFINEEGTVMMIVPAVQSVLDRVINQFMRLTNQGEGTLSGALANFGQVLRDVMVTPMYMAANAIANAVIDALNSIISQFNRLPIPIQIPMLEKIQIQVPGLAKGTLDGVTSAFMAGERGRELIVPQRDNPLSVFPNKATMALERISRMMFMPPPPMPMPSYYTPPLGNSSSESNTNYNNSNNRNVVNNFRHKPTKLELAQMRSDL